MNFVFKKGQIKNIVISCTMIIYFVFGIMVSFNSLNLSERITNKLLVVAVFSLVLFFIMGRARSMHKTRYYICFLLLCFIVLLSALMNTSGTLMGTALCGFLAIILIQRLKLGETETIYKLLFLPYILSCFITIYRYSIESYNSQGLVYSFAGIILLNFLCIKQNKRFSLYMLVVLGEIAVLALTRSRTAMLSFLIAAVFTYVHLFIKKITIKNLLIHLSILAAMIVTYEIIFSFLYESFFKKWANVDITSNRISIWNMIIDRASLFGHGLNNIKHFDAHNTFMQVLDVFGILAFILMAVFVIIIFLNIKRARNSIIYYNFFVAWLISSTFENLDLFTSRMLPVTLIFFLHISLLARDISHGHNSSLSSGKPRRRTGY